ncbi:MAG: hypothetical protein UI647_00625 [Negativibacillus sp.]
MIGMEKSGAVVIQPLCAYFGGMMKNKLPADKNFTTNRPPSDRFNQRK